MTRRATLTQAELTRLANAAKASGVRLVARIGGIEVVADPHAPAVSSPESPDAALDGWMRANGGGVEGAA